MSKYSAITGKSLVLALRKLGFDVKRTKGSHHFLRHPDGRTTVIPVHSGESLGPPSARKDDASPTRPVPLTRGLDGSEQCVVTARRSKLM